MCCCTGIITLRADTIHCRTNLTLRSPNCTPLFTRENPKTFVHSLAELYNDYLASFVERNNHEKLEYILADEELLNYKELPTHLNRYYSLVHARIMLTTLYY